MAGVHALGWTPALVALPQGPAIDLSIVIGVAGTLLAFALFVCTGMIYACLRFLAEWHTPLTPLNYTLLGGASGFRSPRGWRHWPRRRWSAFCRAGRSC